MKKQLLALAMGFVFILSSANAQTVLFNELKPTGNQQTLTFAANQLGYQHRLTGVNVNPIRSDLRLQVRTATNGLFADIMTFTTDGKVGIGTMLENSTAPDFNNYRLFVTGGIRTERVKIDLALASGWADYVFEPTFRLRPLSEVAQFIKKHKHLPDVPSAQELIQKGLDVAEMQKIQMQKIEELTLYIIELKKEIELLKAKK